MDNLIAMDSITLNPLNKINIEKNTNIKVIKDGEPIDEGNLNNGDICVKWSDKDGLPEKGWHPCTDIWVYVK